jgi:type I restriction enzyme S subunit
MSWERAKLNDVLEIKYGKDHKHLKNGKIPIYGSGGIMRFADNHLYDKESILIPRKGTLSNLFFVNIPFWCVDTIFYTIIKEGNIAKYLYYFLKSIDLTNLNVGSAVPSLSTEVLNKIEVSLPPLQTQKRIASILSAYDDLIENNLKRIKLLEETAQNIYKEWFVNFRFPNYENTPFNEETGLPEGWEMKKLNDVSEVLSSKRVFLSDYVEEGIPFYRGKEITQKSNFESISESLFISEEKFLELKSKTGSPVEGDILITGVGTIGNSYLINEFDNDFYFKDGNLLWIKNISLLISPQYLIRYFKSQKFFDVINSICIGSSQKAITINSLKNIEIMIPNKNEILAFTDFCKQTMKQISILIENNQKLKEARDILLPRLMNRTIEI